MNSTFEPTVRQLPSANQMSDVHAYETTRCADNSFTAAFPREVTKVAVAIVDTAGREVLLSGQEGICVQWR
jgi:hypothetical protein